MTDNSGFRNSGRCNSKRVVTDRRMTMRRIMHASEDSDNTDLTYCWGDETDENMFPTKLHHACSGKSALDASVLQKLLRDKPDAAFVRATDSEYPLPLSLLLLHPKRLLEDEELFAFCLELIKTNPSALLQKDEKNEGRLLFLRPIWNWIMRSNCKNTSTKRGKKMFAPNRLLTSEEWLPDISGQADLKQKYSLIDKIVPSSSVAVTISAEVVFCILSALIDDDQSDVMKRGMLIPELSVDEVLELVIVSMTLMPGLLKTALFIGDDRFDEIFKLSIMKHVLLERTSHGRWLKAVIEVRPDRAICYFKEFSKLLSVDLNGLLPSVEEVDETVVFSNSRRRSVLMRSFMSRSTFTMFGPNASLSDDNRTESNSYANIMIKKRNNIIYYLSYDLQLLRLVSQMSAKHQLDAASARLIQKIVDLHTAYPFNSCLTLIDAFFHFILFFAAQVQSVVFLNPEFNAEVYIVASVVTLFSVFYFALREVLQLVSIRSWADFEENVLFDLWNHIDLVSITLLFVSSVKMNDALGKKLQDDVIDMGLRQLLAATSFFKTIFLIHYIRILNQSLAVFISALCQIIVDLKWFVLVLVTLLSMFSQMFLAILPGTGAAESVQAICRGDNSTANDDLVFVDLYCDDIYGYRRFFQQTYEMMLGDWDLEYGIAETQVYPIFAVFTVFVTIILFNMLIAIASDSYADAKLEGPGLFRIMRLNFCAEVHFLGQTMMKNLALGSVVLCNSLIFGYVMHTTVDSTLVALKDDAHYDQIMSGLYITISVMSMNLITACGVLRYSSYESQLRTIRRTDLDEISTVNKCGVLTWYFRPISQALAKVGVCLLGRISEKE